VGWSHFPHDADIGLRGTGADKAGAFAAIGLALTAVVTDPERVSPTDVVSVRCEAPTDETLLFDWLNALIFEMAVGNRVFREFDVRIDDGELNAEIRGETVDREKHEPAVEVKGATYTEILVDEKDEGWVAQCVVDV